MRHIWTAEELKASLLGQPTRRGLLKGAASGLAGAFIAPFIPSAAYAEDLGDINLLAWDGFTFQDYLKDYLSEKGIKLNISNIATQDDVQLRLTGSTPTVIDVTSYNQGYADFYGKSLKIMQPLDEARIPNYNEADIFPEFYRNPLWYWDGKLYGVVMGWGINTLIYAPGRVPEPKSYTDLLKPEYKNKLAFVDDPLANWPIYPRLAGLGDKYPNVTKDELKHIFDVMAPYREQSKIIAPTLGDVTNLFGSGEVGVLFCGWGGFPSETIKQKVETKAVVPVEGGAMWSDAFFTPITAKNRNAANSYINGIISPEVQAKHAAATLSGTINKKALLLMDDATRALFDYNDLSGIFKKAPFAKIPPVQSEEFATFDDWMRAYTDFKAGF